MNNEKAGLPDYLNGRSDAAEGAHIAALLKDDPDFAADAALLRDLRAAVRAQADGLDAGAGLDALRRRITPPSRWRQLLDTLSRPVLAPSIMAALALICVVQGTLLWSSSSPALGTMIDDSAPGALVWRGVTPAPQTALLQVRFDDQASLGQIEAALELAQARIVSGPQVDRTYLLDAAVPGVAVASLRASAVVRDVRDVPAAVSGK